MRGSRPLWQNVISLIWKGCCQCCCLHCGQLRCKVSLEFLHANIVIVIVIKGNAFVLCILNVVVVSAKGV